MSVGVFTAQQVCLKRLLDEPLDNFLKCKRVCIATPPSISLSAGLSPCLRPQNPAALRTDSKSLSCIGPYFLIAPCEDDETYRAVHRHTQLSYTCKVLPLRGYQERLAPYVCLGRHDKIISIIDVLIGHKKVYAFFQQSYGDMHAYVRSRKRLEDEEARCLFGQMVAALDHCHRHGVVLRDLKLRKFVFVDSQRTKLVLQSLEDSCILQGTDDSMTDRHGCPAYVGPELLTNCGVSYSGRAADIWSLGVCLYTMLIGRYPFQDTQPAALFAKIRRGTFSLSDWLSPQAKCLIGCMLRKMPSERLEASELLLHPWLSDTYKSTVPHSRLPHLCPKPCTDQVVPAFTKTS